MSAMKAANSRTKVLHQLDTPYSDISWPEISADDQDTILELLCNYLRPIGSHRNLHLVASKGKRARLQKKRKAKSMALDSTTAPEIKQDAIPPVPEAWHHVDVGFNSITRKLQDFTQSSTQNKSTTNPDCQAAYNQPYTPPYSAVFVCRGDQSASFNCHFPHMVAAASKQCEKGRSIRLVGISKSCSQVISASLGIARVSAVAVTWDAPGAEALQRVINNNVPNIEVRWLDAAASTEYLPTKINAVETTVGEKKAKS